MWTKGNPCALFVEMQIGTVTTENSLEGPQKIKNRTTIWSSYFTSESEVNKNTNSKRYMHPNVHHNIIYNSQDIEAT